MVLGFIRLILALMIVIFHLPDHSIFGYVGMNGSIVVNAFFILSGFFMALVINEKYFITEKKSFLLFISNRVLKIYPTYLLTLVFALVVSCLGYFFVKNWIFLQNYFTRPIDFPTLLILLFVNITGIGIDVLSFFSINSATGQLFFSGMFSANAINYIFIGQAWAIGIELVFYLISPFILRRKTSFLVWILLLSFLLRIILVFSGFENNPWRDRFFLTELTFFMLGAIAYKSYKRYPFFTKTSNFLYIIPITAISLIISFNYLPDFFVSVFSFKEWFFYVGLTVSLPFMFILSNKMRYLDSVLAELSYPIFLVHVVIINLVAIFISFNSHENIAKISVIILTVVYSLFVLKLVMFPIEKFRQDRVKKREKQ
jgi:peptidoglycan/LPS O-acetylase OafA/YrhL